MPNLPRRARPETRTRPWGKGLGLALLLAFAPAARAADTAVAAVADPTSENRVRDDGRRTLRRLPASLGRGTLGVFHGDNLVPFLVSGTAAARAAFSVAPVVARHTRGVLLSVVYYPVFGS